MKNNTNSECIIIPTFINAFMTNVNIKASYFVKVNFEFQIILNIFCIRDYHY